MKITPLKLFFISVFIGMIAGLLMLAGVEREQLLVQGLSFLAGIGTLISVIWIVFTKKKLD